MIIKRIRNLFPKKSRRIEIFARYCFYSAASEHKKRPPHFSRLGCYQNLVSTIEGERHVGLTFLLDDFHAKGSSHFLLEQKQYPVRRISEGTESGSFLRMLDYVESLSLSDETIVYFLEDDYLHRPDWIDVLREGFSLGAADYVTLYDHRDKYSSLYEGLSSRIFHSASCHWRTTPSTTNTYAMLRKTLAKDREVHRAFSQGVTISQDHKKFVELSGKGSVLISPLPGWSTHREEELESPCIDWSDVLSQTTSSTIRGSV